MQVYKVEGNPNLVRDPETGAILNRSRESARRAMESRKLAMDQRKRVDVMEQKIETLVSDMDEIKQLLKLALNK